MAMLGTRTRWVRQPPEDAITDPDYFDFYQTGMTFEAFVRSFSDWFPCNRPAAMLVGIRADESYNRFLAIATTRKQRFADDKPWTTVAPGGHAWYIYPLYDWKTADIWTWFAKSGSSYNPLYDLMFQAGVPPRYMRICEPFGPEQRQGLWLYHVVEPERWAAMCERVSGVRSGGFYAGHDNHFYGHRKILKPDHLCWREYAMLLLDSMPQNTAEHYRNKIAIYLHWYQKRGMEDIPDTQDGDIGAKDIPSWRRICKVYLITTTGAGRCRSARINPNIISATATSEGETQGVGHFMRQRIITEIETYLQSLSEEERINAINAFREAIHKNSPFREQPIDCVLWIKQDAITANDYNPNNVAPPEKRLLSKSLELDGFTQPIVVTESEPHHYEIVDGFHRHEIGKNRAALKRQLKGYLPVTCLRQDRRINMTVWPPRFATTGRGVGIKSTPCQISFANWRSLAGMMSE
jgi:hypothetical protein